MKKKSDILNGNELSLDLEEYQLAEEKTNNRLDDLPEILNKGSALKSLSKLPKNVHTKPADEQQLEHN
jgi:hypothetical protein